MTSSLPQVGLAVDSPGDVKTEHGCLILQPKPAVPLDEPEQIISQQTKFWSSMIANSGLIPLLFVVGVPGNVLSAAVFYRQGLRERINLCIFCLALADIVVITVTFGLGLEAVYRMLVGPLHFFIVHLVGVTGFMWVSIFLSAVIAAERCFCVVSPLLAQRVLSTRTLAVIITCTSVALVTGMQVITGHKRMQICVFDPLTNKTSISVTATDFYKKNKGILDPVDIFVYGFTLPILFFLIVLITTIITAIKLQSAQRWRQQSSSASATGTGSLEKNMVAVTRMLIGTSVLFVMCFTPIPVVQVIIFYAPELQFGGRYRNLSGMMWELISVLRCVNSSLNFFVYYRMGSRFRQTLKELLTCKTMEVVSRSESGTSATKSENSKLYMSTLPDN